MTSKAIYLGELRVEATHLKSGEIMITDAPTDNNGKGQAFSPTDTVATALATCMLTIMGIRASKKNINIQGATAEITKTMASNPRRISKIEVTVTMPKVGIEENFQEVLEAAAKSCPVAQSLHPDIEQVVRFVW
ncbi:MULTISPECIES: OsmC family protein [unclassified Aureispira]|uniref:OsmC family protein n=1 Tax=unclassified Aureispira TaxID=2649989 RepID=UPI00069878E9|nr:MULTISPECIES: OsmC family protein [unclassified Aureispira]WMX12994.1 OsmC family protein [Aureispira sp. CCB-E]